MSKRSNGAPAPSGEVNEAAAPTIDTAIAIKEKADTTVATRKKRRTLATCEHRLYRARALGDNKSEIDPNIPAIIVSDLADAEKRAKECEVDGDWIAVAILRKFATKVETKTVAKIV